MKCNACGKSTPITSWRSLNLGAMTKTSVNSASNRNGKAITYYSFGDSNRRQNQYNIIYACPRCGTLRVKTPIDKT